MAADRHLPGFATGLLTLLAFSNAGGDHIKGGGHIKGVDHTKGGGVLPSGTKTVPQAIVQEEAIPSPYSFNIKTGAAYGTKVTREEVGDAEGRVKGTYTVSSPRGATRVVQYHADDTGFHANIKTSEPNIKTHSPSNAQIEAIPVKDSPTEENQPLSELFKEPVVAAIKSAQFPDSSTEHKTVVKSDPSRYVDSRDLVLECTVIAKGGSDVLAEEFKQPHRRSKGNYCL
ncbi:cuticle protein 16.8 [Trichonephila clavata]|uniref:Cuticle protein 16.8 n=1 Tax=Trichonephila clavata TaxID=2740835 RepID=A0A8X6HG64_TRICU|nr:cuticle protein 16.8 [Trichonephila clavata]